jgi:CheY-like chemotaxis protein
MKILLVDDDDAQRRVAAQLLGHDGNEVVEASSGEAAVAAAAAANFDLVLMDVRMAGGIDGIEATRRIRSLAGTRGRLPIVAMSAAGVPEQTWRGAGADGFMDKNRAFDDGLVEAVKAAIGSASKGRTVSFEVPPAAPAKVETDGFYVPRIVFITVLLGFPALIASGAWYMGTQAAEARNLAKVQVDDARRLADAVVTARTEIEAEQAALNARVAVNGEAVVKLDRDHTESINRIDQRLTRLEAQMSFFVSTGGRR